MIRLIGRLLRAWEATRFLTTIFVVLASLAYGLLTQLYLAPRYDELSWITPAPLFVLIYLSVSFICTVIWMQTVGAPGASNNLQYTLRVLYRQSDRSGTVGWSATLIVLIIGGTYWLYRTATYQHDVVLFFATILVLPLLVDLLPQLPRRYAIPVNAGSLDEILGNLGFEAAARAAGAMNVRERARRALRSYNRDLIVRGDGVVPVEFWADPTRSAEPHPGLMIEVPPVVHELDDGTNDRYADLFADEAAPVTPKVSASPDPAAVEGDARINVSPVITDPTSPVGN